MGKGYIVNAFSINMLDRNIFPCSVSIDDLTSFTSNIKQTITNFIKSGYKSCIGHKDLANIVGVEFNRETVILEKGDMAIVVQYIGERLPEGTTELPENAEIRLYRVVVN